MTVEHSIDHEERAVRKLLSRLRQPRTSALVRSWAEQKQRIEDAAHEVAEHLNIEKGFGVILDMIGSIVLAGRNGLSDDDYKIFLRAKARAIRSTGRPADNVDVLELATNGEKSFRFRNAPPASSVIVLVDELDIPLAPLLELLALANGLGTSTYFYYSTAPKDEQLRYGWSGNPVMGGELGWSGLPVMGDFIGNAARI